MPNIHDLFPSRYLKAEDLKGKKLTVTVEGYDFVQIGKDKKEELVLSLKKQKKQFVVNKTNALAIEDLLGTGEVEEWVNKRITLIPARVDFQGKRVPAIRIEVPEAEPEEPPEDD